MWQQQQIQHGGKRIQNSGQSGYHHAEEPNEQNRSFDVVRVKYINLDSINP